MQNKRPLILFVTAFAVVFGLLTVATQLFAASKEKVLYSFCQTHDCTDGAQSQAGVIFDAAGNLYGTTRYGGANINVTVFELSPGAGGTWKEKVLYSFCSAIGCADGSYPWAGLIQDAEGNLYGTTAYGGATGYGTLFELSPGAGGTWTETVLYDFCSLSGCVDGTHPFAGLIFDSAGNLYGTASSGIEEGVAFELSPGAGGVWTETVLHSFGSQGDGHFPAASLVFDEAENLYGTTAYGGANNGGAVFELSPGAGGTWTETVLYSFAENKDGANPYSG
jgi:uncharacterized repeat protein (TIGR03803 family)